jgi:enoyl-CoA hydratase/carnithine racemase
MTNAIEDCLLIRDESHVRVLLMNRPSRRNALNTDLTQRLLDALLQAEQDANVHAIVLGGQGPSFCAGADVTEFATLVPENAHAVQQRADLTTRLHKCFPSLSKPVIAAVNGHARGGGAGLALACDLLVMAQDATLAYPEASRGLVPAIVMTNLVKQLPAKLAFDLAITGKPLQPEQALALGIASSVVPSGTALEGALQLASQIANYNSTAVRATKALFHNVADKSFEEGMEEGRKANVAMRAY